LIPLFVITFFTSFSTHPSFICEAFLALEITDIIPKSKLEVAGIKRMVVNRGGFDDMQGRKAMEIKVESLG
jgi:hypothetical protein